MSESNITQQGFISGENVYFEYEGRKPDVKVEVELNGLDNDYPISRVIKQDANGDVVVQQMEHNYLSNDGNSDVYEDGKYSQHSGYICEEHNHTGNNNHNHNHSHNHTHNHNHDHDHNHNHNHNHNHSHIHNHSINPQHSKHGHSGSFERQRDIIRDQINRSMNKSFLCDFEYADDLPQMKKFWKDLPLDQKKEICQIESSEVMKVIQDDPKASCSCRVCGNRKVTLEKELQKLYIGYYSVRKLASEALDECELNINLVDNMFGIPVTKPEPTNLDFKTEFNNADTAMNSIMSVADDLVKNNGENFINLVEQLHNASRNPSTELEGHLAESDLYHSQVNNGQVSNELNGNDSYTEKIQEMESEFYDISRHSQGDTDEEKIEEEEKEEQREEEEEEEEDYVDDNDDEAYQFSHQFHSENDQVTRKRLEETYKMLQLITSRVLRIKIYEAFKAKQADDISKSLLDEFAKEEAKLKEKEERQRKKKEKEKERKRLQRLAKEEEKKRLEDERLEKVKIEHEALQKRTEEGRKRKEAEKKRKEDEFKRKQDEKKRKKEAQLEKQRKEKEEKDRKKLEAKKKRENELILKQQKENERIIEKERLQKDNEILNTLSNKAQEAKIPTTSKPPSSMPVLGESSIHQSVNPLLANTGFSNFVDPSHLINPILQSQASYQFLNNFHPQEDNMRTNLEQLNKPNEWGFDGSNQSNRMLQNASFSNLMMGSNIFGEESGSPLVSPQRPPLLNDTKPFLNDVFNSLNNHPNTNNNDIWTNGRSASNTGLENSMGSVNSLNDMNGLTSRQGSIWGNNNSSSHLASPWNTQLAAPLPPVPSLNRFTIEFIQRETLNASFQLPKLENGGYSMNLLYQWVKPMVDHTFPNLTLSQFITALTTNLESKLNVSFLVGKDAFNSFYVVLTARDISAQLSEFGGLSLIEGYGSSVGNGNLNPSNLQPNSRVW